MKVPYIIFFILLISGQVAAQNWESYQISVKGDTINSTDKNKLKQGKWVLRVEALRGEPGYEEEGEFLDNRKEGPWRRYSLMGDLLAIEKYRWGFRDGKQMYFTPMGDLLREEGWRAVNPENPYDTIEVPELDNPLVMTQKVVKQESSEIRHGTWKYYDPSTGTIVKTESFSYGQKLDASGRPVATTGSTGTTKSLNDSSKATKKPATVEEWENKQSGKKKVKVRDGRTGGDR
jgi:hypothetical protein